jgi:repressor LexA
MLTRKQTDFLQALIENYGKEPLPSYDKISEDLGYKSKNSVWQYFQKLLEHNLIRMNHNRFFLSPDLFGINYFADGVKAGFPSPAEDYQAEKISFDEMLVRRPDSTFTVRVSGDSMIDAGIQEDDIAIVDKALEPRNGDIVVAVVDGEFTMKYFKKTKGDVILEPANINYPPIKALNELQIFGVVTGIVRQIIP